MYSMPTFNLVPIHALPPQVPTTTTWVPVPSQQSSGSLDLSSLQSLGGSGPLVQYPSHPQPFFLADALSATTFSQAAVPCTTPPVAAAPLSSSNSFSGRLSCPVCGATGFLTDNVVRCHAMVKHNLKL